MCGICGELRWQPGITVGTKEADEFEFSDFIAAQFKTRHHKHLIPNSEVLARLPEAVAALIEPTVDHEVLVYCLLSERVSKEVKLVPARQGTDEVERFSRHYIDRQHAEFLETIAPDWHVPDVTTELVVRELAKQKAVTFLDQLWHFDLSTLIVEDSVKRVDNMPMAWGLGPGSARALPGP